MDIEKKINLIKVKLMILELDPYEVVTAKLDSFSAYESVTFSDEVYQFIRDHGPWDGQLDEWENDDYLYGLRDGHQTFINEEKERLNAELLKLMNEAADEVLVK